MFTFPFGILGQLWYLVVSIPEPCYLSYFENSSVIRYIRASVYGDLVHNLKDSLENSELARKPAFPDQFKNIRHYKSLE